MRRKVFEKYGIEIAESESGEIDVTRTYLNVVDYIDSLTDHNEKAAASIDIFGRWWNISSVTGQPS